MIIKRIPTEKLAEIIAGLVTKGLTFEAVPADAAGDEWEVVLTGGF